ncbi:divergent polysaccharide deacetylase family protein [Pseudodesulfovibrio senegalensis]|jgi:hypothetical protein|uniref:Divergent polysaccharide deacetylase family protein n=1 Tax=Pseudodesulfovibrio senegalensis TaxID=1721087 RepID=A0A6N6N6B7_9BACT|nr:divergent polysaccharide deacetylase family protein [Pseudodesulfovibrio senegalensis]KAB1443790.1 divergent polysaccharide deacetylase family protein [Pseudodesulfovibrio senegalensis]
MTQDREPLESGSEKTHSTEKETGLDRLKHRLFRPGVLIAVFAVVLCGMGVVIHLLMNSAPPVPVVMESKEPVVLQAVSPESSKRIYEEAFGGLEEIVKQVDFALLEALRTSGIDMQRLELDEVTIRSHAGQDYHFQRLRIPNVKKRDAFLLALQKSLSKRVTNAYLTGDGDHVSLMVGDVNTHDILLDGIRQTPSAPAPNRVNGPKLVVVIDDVGENMKILKGLLSIDLPLVYAVWPASSHMNESVRLLRKAGRDILVHFPMQPKGYPRVNPGEGALFVTMNAREISNTVRKYVAMIPEAIGANNHMGSLFTENKPGMRAALKEFKKRGLFFLDSMTTPKSVGRDVARSIAIPFYKRNVFLDNVKDVSSIVYQLRKAERIAQSRGQAIAIGHPHPATLAAIRQWATRRNKKVTVVPLSRLKPAFSDS